MTRRRSLPQIVLAALGLTELSCFFIIAPLLHPRHAAVYHWSGTASSLFVPVFLDLILGWVSIGTLLVCVHPSGLLRRALWLGFLLVAPVIVSYNWDLLFNGAASTLTLRLLLGSLIVGVILAFRWRLWKKAFAQIADFVATVMIFFGVGGVFVLGQLAWIAWQARGLNRGSNVQGRRETSVLPAPQARIIWIIFDELSHQQVYEQRLRGLALPAFDGLAAQSNVFTHTVPAGIFTDIVLPSLMSGRRIDLVRSSANGSLSIHDPQSRTWRAFDPNNTVFDDALRNGYSTSIAGWYVPYCRILLGTLDDCFWSYDIPIKNAMSSQRGVLGNMLAPFLSAMTGVTGWVPQQWLVGTSSVQAFRTYGAEMHIEDYDSISRAAETALRNPSADFVLLHFPVPHLGGIYNRTTRQLTTGTSTYLDNLALADRCLAHLRDVLEQTGQWDSSIVVVMGDHSWRIGQMMPDSGALQGEEIEASHGERYDPRPVYVVKLAGQRIGVHITTAFSAVNTRPLLDVLMRGSIRTSEDLEQEIQRLH